MHEELIQIADEMAMFPRTIPAQVKDEFVSRLRALAVPRATPSKYPYDDRMDPECIPLCDVLNDLPGITTIESCWGHGVRRFGIWFIAETIESLRPILKAIHERGEMWQVHAEWASGGDGLYFGLMGPAGAGGANEVRLQILEYANNLSDVAQDQRERREGASPSNSESIAPLHSPTAALAVPESAAPTPPAAVTITEELLECTDLACGWVGFEEQAIEDGNEEDSGYLCPACNEQCAHFPLNEIGLEVKTVISQGWTMKADPASAPPRESAATVNDLAPASQPNSTPGRIKKELADLRAENQRKGELIQELTTNMGFLSDSILAHDAELVRLRDSEGRLRIGLDAGIDGIEFAIAYFGRTEGSIVQRLNDRLTSARAALSQPEPPAAPKVEAEQKGTE